MRSTREKAGAGSPGGFAVPPALQGAWIRQLRCWFETYNGQYLRRQLAPPLFCIGDSQSRLGEWNPAARSITISATHILAHPWERVLETLRHEMAHQYVHEVLGLAGARPHGEAFAEACRLLRCDPLPQASGGSLGDLAQSNAERDRILVRVRELLALAGSPNEHEAASAMRMANRYLLKYNLSLDETEGPRRYATRCLGRCSGRIQEYEYTLSHILEEHFFVVVIWTFSYRPLEDRRGRILEVSGTPENLEMAEYVYNYVMGLTESLWRAHRRVHPDVGGTRRQYLAGLLRGLAEKLDRQRDSLKEEQGLVWLGDSRLEEYFRHLHPRICRIGGWGVSRGARYRAGLSDGREITIRRGLGGSAVCRGRLLE